MFEKKEASDKRPRRHKPVGIIIHHTDIGNRNPDLVTDETWRSLFKNITGWLTKKDDVYVSAHYHIGRFGETYELVDPFKFVAFHAGRSKYWHPETRAYVENLNEYYIGIELLGDGNKGMFSEAQYDACAKVCAYLLDKFPSIMPHLITGHENVSPGRKVDPGRFFDWRKLFDRIYKAK